MNERVHFRYLVTPCCHQQLCWVNARLPMHCPECGKHIYPAVRSCVHVSDEHATLRYSMTVLPSRDASMNDVLG